MVLNGNTYETEASTTYSTGTWGSDGCNPGNKQSEWLHCAGYFAYGGAGTPAPQPQPQPQTSLLKIFAAGEPANGVYPSMALLINGQQVHTFDDIRGDAGGRSFVEYSYSQTTPIDISQVRIVYTNDLYAGPGNDRNLRVDKVTIDGTSYETESNTTYSTGTWAQGSDCNPGNKQSEWLHCAGYFQYGSH